MIFRSKEPNVQVHYYCILFVISLTHLLKKVFSPTCLKLAKVVPIHKAGSKDEPNNYCPISVLTLFDKMIEKIMKNN